MIVTLVHVVDGTPVLASKVDTLTAALNRQYVLKHTLEEIRRDLRNSSYYEVWGFRGAVGHQLLLFIQAHEGDVDDAQSLNWAEIADQATDLMVRTHEAHQRTIGNLKAQLESSRTTAVYHQKMADERLVELCEQNERLALLDAALEENRGFAAAIPEMEKAQQQLINSMVDNLEASEARTEALRTENDALKAEIEALRKEQATMRADLEWPADS